MQKLGGTMKIMLAETLASADGKRSYRAGEIVEVSIHAGADVRVWSGNRPPVLATFKELVGSEIIGSTWRREA